MLYATSFVFVSPIIFSYIYWHGFNILNVFILLIGFLFVPIVPIVIMSFVSLLIAQITKRMKYGKIMSLILMIAAFLGLFMLSFSMNSVEQNPLTGQIDLFKGISDIYKPFDWFRNAVSQNSIESLLYILISHGLILVLFIFGMEKIVHKTNQQGIRIRYRNDGRPLKYHYDAARWCCKYIL